MTDRLNPRLLVSAVLFTGSCMFFSSLAATQIGRGLDQSAQLFVAPGKNYLESVLEDNNGREFVTIGNRFPNNTFPLMIGTRDGVMFGLVKMDNPGCMISLDIAYPPSISRVITLREEELSNAIKFILAKTPESC